MPHDTAETPETRHETAGKTTTMRILATLLTPDAGTARVLGHDVVSQADEVRRAIALAGQSATVDDDLTGREDLLFLGRLAGLRRHAARTLGSGVSRRDDLVCCRICRHRSARAG